MRFRALDGFRGLCALLVALYHVPICNHLLGVRFFLPHAQMLMDFFFVLSGFLIAGAYGERLKDGGDVRSFALSRFARLWPLHAAMLGVFVALEASKAVLAPHAGLIAPFSGARPAEGILTNLFLLQSLHLHDMLTWNAPSWTVSVEFWTYLLFAGLTVLLPRRQLMIGLVMATVGGLGVALIAHKLDASYDWGVFRCFYGFFTGVVTWQVFKAAPLRLQGRPVLAALIEVGALVGVFAYMSVLGGWPTGLIGPIIFAGFVWLFAAEQGIATRALSARPLLRLGELSYSIYLVHYPLIMTTAVGLRLFQHMTGVSFAAYGFTGLDQMSFIHGPSLWVMDGVMVGYLAVVVGVATLTWRFIEEPGRKLFRHRPASVQLAAAQPA